MVVSHWIFNHGIVWVAYTSKSVQNGTGLKKFIGSSDNWKVVLEIENDNDRQQVISYLGEGSLEDQEEVWIRIRCTPACDSPARTISVIIKWDGKEEKFDLKRVRNHRLMTLFISYFSF